MKKKIFMSAAKKARIALAVMAVCGFTLAGTQNAFAENVTIDDKKNIICGEGATASRNPLQKDDGTNIVVIGNNATGIGSETIAIGYKAKAEGEYSIAFGSSAYAFYGGVSIGDLSETTYDAVAIGLRAKGSGRDSVAIGKDAKAEGQDSLAIADSSVAKGEKSVALGYQAKAAGETSMAIGYRSSAEAKGSFALGSNSSATKENSVAIGAGSVANRNNSVSVGSGGSEFYGPQYRQIINVAYGTSENDAATYGQILRDTWSTIKIDDDGNGSTKLTKNDGTQGPTINVDASSLNKKITRNTNSITALDNKIGSLNADGNYIKKANNVSQNLSALDNKVKANEGAITAVDNKIGSLSADGNYIKKANKVAQNLSAIDEQVFKNETAIGTLSSLTTNEKTNLVGAVNEVKGTADTALGLANTNKASIGTLTNLTTTEKGNLVGAINEVKGSVDAANTAIAGKADLDLGNISTAGETKIKDLASIKAGEVVADKLGAITSTNYVSASGKVNANISALDTQVKANADDIIAANTKITNVDNKIGSLSADGKYIKKANNVSANLVELDKQVNTNATAITNKANLDLSNINAAGENVIKNLAGNKAGEIVDTKLGTITSTHYVSTGNTVNANISALDTQLNNVDNKIGTMTDGNYISAGNTVAGNLSALDNQLKANTEAINTKADKDLSNITDAGKNVIKDLAGNKAGEVVDAKLGDITSENYVKKADTVNANISALDKQMKANADDIITANNKITNVDNKIGDLAKLDTAEKGNLVGAVNEVNKKADKNADDIKTVNGRVDELGGRVDTLGGAVSKLDTKVNKVGAGAAALAALHPMDFDPDNKLTFAAGVGNYRGANAAAIGAFYRPNEQVMFSIAGNMGNGENMVNAGVSFALDRPSQTPTTKAALVKTVAAQNEQIAALNETVAEQNEKIARLEAMVEKLAAKQNA